MLFRTGRSSAPRLTIEIFAVTLQIDLDSVQQGAHLLQRLRVHETAAYQHAAHLLLAGQGGDIGEVLHEHGGFIIGEGDDGRLAPGCGGDYLARGYKFGVEVFGAGLGYFPVLTEFAVQTASRGCKGEGFRTREEVVEGFFLDGVCVNGYGAAVGESPQLSVHIYPHPAFSALSGPDNAALGA
jgi:hypothetical protein